MGEKSDLWDCEYAIMTLPRKGDDHDDEIRTGKIEQADREVTRKNPSLHSVESRSIILSGNSRKGDDNETPIGPL